MLAHIPEVRTCVRDLAGPPVRRAPALAQERQPLGCGGGRAREANVPLEDALKLVYLYAEKEQWEKFERAAMKWLRRYLAEKEPTLRSFAKVVRGSRKRAAPREPTPVVPIATGTRDHDGHAS
jgi:hypothetical protein